MSAFEVSLRAHLIAEVDLNGGRVYPQNLPHGPELPAQTYQVISGNRRYTHSGDAKVPQKRIQVDNWSKNYGEARQMAGQTIEALSGFMGAMQDTDVGKSHLENEQDAYNPDTGMYHVPLDFKIGYYE